ncbi:MAG TPA: phosphoenolpyruvate hydrolase family protein [Candidatus Ventricola gallistercoris]|nr:phosphoenolpyruvate hydrolase family protein [Candidatus Ventricola gallistercoris]
MAKKYSRSEVLSYLRAIRSRGERIVVAGAGSGLTGKTIEAGGADMLMVFNSGKYRMAGHGSLSGWLAFGNANEVAFSMGAHEVLPVVKEVPVICSCFGQDVTREIGTHLDRVMTENFSGINNFPTIGMIDGNFREQLELTGLGFDKEVEMVRTARSKDIFTIVYVFNAEESAAMAQAGADAIIAHVGLTVGGMIGTTKSLTIEDSAKLTREIMEAGKSKRDDVIYLAHGGPLAAPKDFEAFLKLLPEIDGFVGASSMERIPTEEAIVKTVKEFKAVR